MILGSVQPAYLAWYPFYKRMQMSDVFIYLDDVKYSKNSFHNRNRIKTPNGPLILTVPVLYKGNSEKFISEIEIQGGKWKNKHLRSIEMNYSKAKHFDRLFPGLKAIYEREWSILGDLNIEILEFFRRALGIETKCYRSSEQNITEGGNEKLVELCKRFECDSFVVKPNTEDYHPGEFFREHGISFSYFHSEMPEYPQLHGPFVKGLSILDFAMNCGPDEF